jgi:hypothetical protein
MPRAQTNQPRALRYLEVFEGSWQRDHHEAMACYELEEALTEGVSVFQIIQECVSLIKQGLFQGEDLPADIWDLSRELYRRWLAVAESHYGQVGEFERAFGRVRNAQELKGYILSARDTLDNWEPVSRPIAVGSRVITLSEAEAAELHALRNAPPGSPGKLGWTPQAVPTADASFFE